MNMFSTLFVCLLYAYISINKMSGSQGCQKTGQVGRTICERHKNSGKSWRNVQVVNFETRIDATIKTHSNGQNGNGKNTIATSVRGDNQTNGRTILTYVYVGDEFLS